LKNLDKLFKQKSSVEFNWVHDTANLKYYKQIIIRGDHSDYHNVLSSKRVVELLTGGQNSMCEFATLQGYIGFDTVEFSVEPGFYSLWIGDSWSAEGGFEIDIDVFRLIAKPL